MRWASRTYKVFEWEELNPEEKQKAIIDYAQLYLNCDYEHLPEEVKKAVDKADDMQTPWFALSYILEYASEMIAELLADAEFLSGGEFYRYK